MTVTNVHKDPTALTMTITAEFTAPIEQTWRLWADPRLLERWWGPPTYPATVVDHDLVPTGRVSYFMTGPGGDRHHGWWRVIDVSPPSLLVFEDGFADEHGRANPDLPTTITRVTLEATDGGTSMTILSTFSSLEQMEQLVAMGVEEGMKAAMGQMDALLAA